MKIALARAPGSDDCSNGDNVDVPKIRPAIAKPMPRFLVCRISRRSNVAKRYRRDSPISGQRTKK